MSLQTLKVVFLSSLSLSLLLGNSAALAQFNDGNSGAIVVPTIPSGGTSAPIDAPINTPTNIPPVTSGTRFSCQFYNGQYTVMYQPQNQSGEFFPWAAPRALGDGWNPQRRCEAIASRLEVYRPDGLQELQIAVENNENIVCVTTENNPFCRIVLTVPPEKDPYAVRNDVFQNLMTADNGQQTLPVNTYGANRGGVNDLYNLGRTLLGGGNNRPTASSKAGINLKPYLAPEDGGTLRSGAVSNPQSQPASPGRLNPGNFR
ncbi:COP23 domain-containing protein [Nodularia harveyana UHCC-0300]|uniref:COP23 domain-containing protein n=1 Tax=Nodularia harveyana UHCC-0300 TaxID=2974287 RepID=A0ABU5UGQ1_9CYAN|nr:COP23 domain-containing protein [Nodularia harveyana]MEA5582692.1 COP23 domain-containing protein [Nodularia harveyana UHCC-0300]